MSFPKLTEAEAKLSAKQKEMGDIFAQAGPDIDLSKVKGYEGDVAEAITALDAELADLGAEVIKLRAIGRASEAAKGYSAGDDEAGPVVEGDTGDIRPKSIGEQFTKSTAYTGRAQHAEAHIDIDVKTLMTTSAGWAPESVRTGKVVDAATRPIQVVDLIPSVPTTQAAVVYMEETTFTNGAVEVLEGGTYGESAFVLTQRTSLVKKIGVWIPVTDEQLADEPMAAAYINRRLGFGIAQRLDLQILVGNGVAQNIEGIGIRSGIQTQAKGTDPVHDAIHKAMTKVKVTGQAMPDAVVLHPNDWQDVRLTRTSDGIYLWGNPSDTGAPSIFGLRVVEAQAQTENTGLVGDFGNYSELATRAGIDVQVTNSHASDFISGKQAVRADTRVALQVFRPAAFCTVTGI